MPTLDFSITSRKSFTGYPVTPINLEYKLCININSNKNKLSNSYTVVTRIEYGSISCYF